LKEVPTSFSKKGSHQLPFFVKMLCKFWRDSKSVMQRIANPSSPVRLWVAPPDFFMEIQKSPLHAGFFVPG
jgi:hypothetical protein